MLLMLELELGCVCVLEGGGGRFTFSPTFKAYKHIFIELKLEYLRQNYNRLQFRIFGTNSEGWMKGSYFFNILFTKNITKYNYIYKHIYKAKSIVTSVHIKPFAKKKNTAFLLFPKEPNGRAPAENEMH